MSGVGRVAAPGLIFEGTKMHSSWASMWPEAFCDVSDSGYMTEDLFRAWVGVWLEETDPGNGDPRVLFLDNHFSHLGLETLRLLREHNVRVVSLHPHTTHALCVLDVAIFKQFKGYLESLFEKRDGPITIDTVAGLIKLAYGRATQITVDTVTGMTTSAAINGFAKVGLIPFTKKVLVDGVFGAATFFAESMKKEGPDGQPIPPKPLAITAEERASLVDDIKSQHLQVKLAREAAPTQINRPRVMSQLLTHSQWLEQEEATKAAKEAAAAEKAQRTATRKENAIANKAVKDAKAAERALKAAKKAEHAAASAVAAVVVAPQEGAGRKRSRAAVSAVDGARKPVKRIRGSPAAHVAK